MELPAGLAPLGGDDAVGAQLVADVAMIALAVELSISHDQPDSPVCRARSTTGRNADEALAGPALGYLTRYLGKADQSNLGHGDHLHPHGRTSHTRISTEQATEPDSLVDIFS